MPTKKAATSKVEPIKTTRPKAAAPKIKAKKPAITAPPAKRQPPVKSAPAPKTARRRQPEEVKARILAAALNTFATHGFDGATIAMIAEEAGVKISLLLYHFQSKDSLWRAVVDDIAMRSPLLHILDAGDGEYASSKEKLRAVIRRVVEASAAEPNLHLLIVQEARKPSERLHWLCETFIKKDFESLCDLIRAAQREGAVRSDVNAARLRYAILALAAVPFSVSAEYQYLTKHDPFSHAEVENAVEFIDRLVFQ